MVELGRRKFSTSNTDFTAALARESADRVANKKMVADIVAILGPYHLTPMDAGIRRGVEATIAGWFKENVNGAIYDAASEGLYECSVEIGVVPNTDSYITKAIPALPTYGKALIEFGLPYITALGYKGYLGTRSGVRGGIVLLNVNWEPRP